uniref:RNA helicase n=1 Tax=Scylla olivacea TaxID=85551 RepID=A0A0P4VW63_SCYOL
MEWQQPTRQSERPCIGPSLSQYSERMEFTPGNTVMFRPSEVVQIETVSGSSSSYDQEEIIPQYLQGSVSKKFPENYSSENTCSVLWKSPKYSHGSSIPIWLPRNKSANMSDRKKSCSNVSDRAHCESLRSAEPGMLCAVQDEGIWTRAQIISVNHKEAGTLINAFLVDEGKQVTVNLESALVLPSYLATVPHLVVEVLLCRVQPMDFDPEWTLQASNFVYSIFAKRKDSRFIGRINLALGSTLWLNPVAEFIKIGKTFVQKKALREKLISEKFGVDNPTHMKNIQHLCAKAGVSLEQEAMCGQAWRKILTESLERLQADRVKEDPCGNTSANPGVYFERYSNEETQSMEEQKNNVIGSRANTLCSISQGRQVLLPQHQEQETCSITPPDCPALPQEDLSFNQTVKAEVVEAVSLKELIKADEVKELNSLEAEISCSAEWLGSSDHKALDVESYCCLRSMPCSASCIASVTSNKYCKDVIRASRSSDSTTVFFADHGETMQVSACQHDEKQGTGTECKVQEKRLSGSFNNTSVSILQDEMYKLMSPPLKNGVRKDTCNSVESLKNECQNHSLCTESKGETVFSSVYATLPKYHHDGADKEEELSKRVTDDQEKYQGCIKTGESTFVGQQDDMFLLRHIGISRTTGLASEISWSQDEDVVQVIIHLAGVEQYKCHLSSSQLVFMTSIKEKLHALDGNLAGEIDADHSFVTVHRNNICIILRKAIRGEWRCLFSSGNNKSKASQE